MKTKTKLVSQCAIWTGKLFLVIRPTCSTNKVLPCTDAASVNLQLMMRANHRTFQLLSGQVKHARSLPTNCYYPLAFSKLLYLYKNIPAAQTITPSRILRFFFNILNVCPDHVFISALTFRLLNLTSFRPRTSALLGNCRLRLAEVAHGFLPSTKWKRLWSRFYVNQRLRD